MSAVQRAAIYSGGYAHPFAETSALLAERLAERGMLASVDEALDSVLANLDGSTLLIVNALRWTMVQHEKYSPFRADFADRLGLERLARIESHVADGGALLAMHTAVICWDDQPGWRALLGGGWDWGRSHHPPLGEVEVSVSEHGARHGVAVRQGKLVDEAYHALDPAPDCAVWAEARVATGWQPVVWTRRHGQGRVAIDALGHDRRSLEAPVHDALLGALIDWLADEWDGHAVRPR